MRTLEEWFKYLEQQYVDEEAQKQKKEETQPPAQKEGGVTPASLASATSRTVTPSVQSQPPAEPSQERKAVILPMLDRGQITETPAPDPAEYIFTLRRTAGEPTPKPQTPSAEETQSAQRAQSEPEPQPTAKATPPVAEEAIVEQGESVTESPTSEAPPPETERSVRAKGARRAPYTRSVRPVPPPQSIEELWRRVPKHVRLLVELGDDEVTQRYYDRRFKESRQELVEHLLNPSLTLEDTARLLGVCPTTVRRYTERGLLNHYRTPGNQRRFRLSDVIAFLEARQQAQEARRQRKR
ncbi:MAG: helix-turn-helix domain-containing protein [Armatimonadota bacterium]